MSSSLEYRDRKKAERAIQTVLGMRKEIRTGLQPIYERKLNNEPMQEELNEFFADYEKLYELVELIDEFGSDTITSELLEESDIITQDVVGEMKYFWESIGWIQPAYTAHEQQQSDYKYWTETAIEYKLPAGLSEEFVIVQEADHGLDELWSVRAPLHEFIIRLGSDIGHIAEQLEQAKQEAPGMVVSNDEKERLQRVLGQFRDSLALLEEEVDTLSPYSETGLDVTFDDLLTTDAEQIVANAEGEE